MRKVAYITSGKVGIHRFTLNELILLEEKGINFDLCLTQLNKGPCMPKKTWNCYIASRKMAILEFVLLLYTKPLVIRLLIEAKNKQVLSYFFISLSLYRNIKNNNISSLHCQMGDDKLYIGYFLKKLMKIPLSVTVHAHELYQKKVYDQSENIKDLYSYCDKVITISDFNASMIQKRFGVGKERIEIMRLFPDIDIQKAVKHKAKILIVANWVEKKGYAVLLKALKKIKRDDFILWVVGGSVFSDDSIDVEALVKEYALEDKVAILGRQGSPILDIIFHACDIFCLPSYTDFYEDGNPSEREGIPVALMEAMAWGKPVIATNHAGNPELVETLLVEERDINELSIAISYLLDNKEQWHKLGEVNKEIIKSKYSKKNINTLIKVLNNL